MNYSQLEMHSPAEYGAALIGLVIGGILFGMSIIQANSYFHKCHNDPLWQKLSIAVLCILDTLHLCFSIHMMYHYLIDNFGNIAAVSVVTWSLKGLATVQVAVIWLVQFLYLLRIWKLSKRIINNARVYLAISAGIVVIIIVAVGAGLVFAVEINELRGGLSISRFRWVIFFSVSTSVVIDICITCFMSFLLYQNRTGVGHTDGLIYTLIKYIIGTGLLTSVASTIFIVIYVVKPNTFFYLALEFSITILYCNSYLVMMNARVGLRHRFSGPVDLEIALQSPNGFGFSPSTIKCPQSNEKFQSPHLPPNSPDSPIGDSALNVPTFRFPPCLEIPVPHPKDEANRQIPSDA